MNNILECLFKVGSFNVIFFTYFPISQMFIFTNVTHFLKLMFWGPLYINERGRTSSVTEVCFMVLAKLWIIATQPLLLKHDLSLL